MEFQVQDAAGDAITLFRLYSAPTFNFFIDLKDTILHAKAKELRDWVFIRYSLLFGLREILLHPSTCTILVTIIVYAIWTWRNLSVWSLGLRGLPTGAEFTSTLQPSTNEFDPDEVCAFCRDTHHEPMQLPCGHVFCKACLEILVANNIDECSLCWRRLYKADHAKLMVYKMGCFCTWAFSLLAEVFGAISMILFTADLVSARLGDTGWDHVTPLILSAGFWYYSRQIRCYVQETAFKWWSEYEDAYQSLLSVRALLWIPFIVGVELVIVILITAVLSLHDSVQKGLATDA